MLEPFVLSRSIAFALPGSLQRSINTSPISPSNGIRPGLCRDAFRFGSRLVVAPLSTPPASIRRVPETDRIGRSRFCLVESLKRIRCRLRSASLVVDTAQRLRARSDDPSRRRPAQQDRSDEAWAFDPHSRDASFERDAETGGTLACRSRTHCDRMRACRHLSGRASSSVFTDKSILNCPHCAFAKEEVMPADACLFFYECNGCGGSQRNTFS